MKALVFDRSKNIWDKSVGFEMLELPKPFLDEKKNPEDATSVIIKLKYAGVCGSDKNLWYRTAFKDMIHDSLDRENKNVRITGHEFIGDIIEQGSMVHSLYHDADPKNIAKIKIGSLVSGDSHVTCGRCYQCRIGEQNVCMNESILGITIDGIFAEYAKIPAKNLWPVDITKVRSEIASIYDPFGNAVYATTKVDLRGQRVAIFGVGPIGLFSVLLARHFGSAKVIAVDVNKENLKIAKKLGAHETILISAKKKKEPFEYDKNVIDKIMELTYGKGVDVSMEMAGYNSSINNTIEATRRGGHIILFGLKDGDVVIPKFSKAIIRGLTFHGIIGREIFRTWQIAQRVLNDKTNGIQDAIWNIILKKGEGTILPFKDFSKESFEEAMKAHPKIILKF